MLIHVGNIKDIKECRSHYSGGRGCAGKYIQCVCLPSGHSIQPKAGVSSPSLRLLPDSLWSTDSISTRHSVPSSSNLWWRVCSVGTQVSSFTARHSLGKSRKSQTVRWARSHSEVIRYWRPLTSHPDTQGDHWHLDPQPRHDRTVRTSARHGVIYKERKSLNGWRSGFSGGSHDF